MKNLLLITIPMSHYCEKVRWAMDRIGLEYKEERHIQGFHYIRSFITSHGPNVPVLIDNKKVITNSNVILKHLEQYAPDNNQLYPSNLDLRHQVEQLETLYDEQLGVDSRRWLYYQMMHTPYTAISSMAQGVPLIEKILLPLLFPGLYLLIRSHPDTMKKDVEIGFNRALSIIEQTDALLADGRQFLVGDKFSAADVSLACMMSPFIVPTQYGIRLPEIKSLPNSMQKTIHQIRNTATGRHALKMFRTERFLQKNPIIDIPETNKREMSP